MSNGLSATLDDDDARRRIFPHNIITKTQRDIIISVDKNSRFYFKWLNFVYMAVSLRNLKIILNYS